MNGVNEALATLGRGNALSRAESQAAFAALLDGEVTDVAAAVFLTALRVKGETADELEGAVAAVRERMSRWESGLEPGLLLDTCGTGGDGAGTVNISTAAAIVAAACGVPVVKHGNRAATGLSGSSDVLSALGIAANPVPDLSRRCMSEIGIAFLYAPAFHPGLGRLAPLRRQLPFRTIFNLIGPLCNPGSPALQLVGATTPGQAELIAQVLCRQDHITRAAVVTGCDGLDEVTLGGPTTVWAIGEGRAIRETWQPEDFGLARQSATAIAASGPGESAHKLMRAFAGEQGPVRDYLLANSAAALWVARQAPLREGTALAAAAIDSGAATALVERWKRLTPAEPA